MILRRLRDDDEDAETARAVCAAALGASRALTSGSGDARPSGRDARARSRVRHLARTDPEGCWLALDDTGTPVGAVLSTRREGTWGCRCSRWRPRRRGGRGARTAGRRPGVRARVPARHHLRYGRPRAAATYRRAGFTLHPAMRLRGRVDKGALAPPDGAVHEGTSGTATCWTRWTGWCVAGARPGPRGTAAPGRAVGGGRPDGQRLLLRHRHRPGAAARRDDAAAGEAAADRGPAERAGHRRGAGGAPDGRAGVGRRRGLDAGLEVANHGYVCLRGMRPRTRTSPRGSFCRASFAGPALRRGTGRAPGGVRPAVRTLAVTCAAATAARTA
ncbi:GNAT family N-acetyltransferase [Streptomyces sp. M19]